MARLGDMRMSDVSLIRSVKLNQSNALFFDMRLLTAVLLACVTSWTVSGQTYTISTFAGGGLPVNILGTSAALNNLQTVAVDNAGNLFFADGVAPLVLRLDAITGLLTIAAGNGLLGESGDNGPATAAQFGSVAVALDTAGNLYIADTTYCRIRKVSNGVITTVAGTGICGFSGDNGSATSAQLYQPGGVAVDAAGDLYIADTNNYRIRKVSNGVITTVAGNGMEGFSGDNGPATSAELGYVAGGIAVDAVGNLYIADFNTSRVREVSNGVITTVAGNGGRGDSGDGGPATSASLNSASGVAVDTAGELFIATGAAIRKVSKGVITTVASGLSGPTGVSVDSAGNLYVIVGVEGASNNAIQKISKGVITTLAGGGTFGADNGPATDTQLYGPAGVAVDAADVYFTDGYDVRKVSNGIITTVAGIGGGAFFGDGGPATSAALLGPTGLAVDAAGNLYIADSGAGRIREVSQGIINTVAGNGAEASSGDNGPATSAGLGGQLSVALDSAGNLYIADANNNRVRKVSNGVITTVAGNGTAGFSGDNGPATSAQLNGPSGLAVDSAGNLYIADSVNSRIREVSNGVITTVAGPDIGRCGANAECFGGEWKGVAADSAGNLYVAVWGFLNYVLKVSNGAETIIAGNGASTFSGDNGPATSAGLNPTYGGIAVDASGDVYVADAGNYRIRLLTPPPLSITGPSSIPTGVVGVAYSGVTLAATGGTGIYTWSATGLPNGLSLSAAGVLSGTPLLVGTFNAQFVVKDSGGKSASIGFSITISPVSPPVISSLSPSSAAAGAVAFTLTVNGTGFLSGATVQWNGSALPTTFVSATQLTASVVASLIASVGSAGIVVVNPGGASSSAASFSIVLTQPAVTQGGVVPLYSPVPVVQPGSWVSIYGNNLSNGTYTWNGDFPTSLGGVSVTIDNKLAYLWYVSPTLINLQVPDDATPGTVNVVVNTPFGPAPSTVTLAQYGPSFLLQSDGKHALAIVLTPGLPGNSGFGYDIIGPSRPVNPGETMVLYGVGFGPTTPPVPAGQAFAGAASTNSQVTITIGGVPTIAAFAGIIEAGLYQINLTVPANTGDGDQGLQGSVNGVQTPAGPVVTLQ